MVRVVMVEVVVVCCVVLWKRSEVVFTVPCLEHQSDWHLCDTGTGTLVRVAINIPRETLS